MFTAILAILGILAVIAAFGAFIVNIFPYIAEAWSWMMGSLHVIESMFPDWVLPLFLLSVVVAAVSLIVKVI